MARRLTALRLLRRPGDAQAGAPPTGGPSSPGDLPPVRGGTLGTRAIADELNRRGVSNRTGKPWSGHTINRIIANPAYAGDIAYGDVYVENAHEPLISRETWRKACEITASRADAR